MNELGTGRVIVLYVGALLGPSALILPGVAAGAAGPASVLAWGALLMLSALLAWTFSALGARLPARGGAAGYVGAAFGRRAERAVAACFVSGVIAGAPVVCLIGGSYAARALGGGRVLTVGAAAAMLAAVVALTLAGTRVSAAVQLALVGTLVVLVAVAVAGAAPHARARNWHPFAPHGWAAVGHAAALLMLSFVGWEAIAPLIGALPDRARRLPRVIAAAFAITSLVYVGLAVATIGVLGSRASSHTPVADLLAVALGHGAAVTAGVAAVALTLAAVNAYLTGASETIAALRERPDGRGLPLGVLVAGLVVLAAVGTGHLAVETLIAVPTVLFVAVYVACMAAGVRELRGPVRVAAAVGFVAVAIVFGFSGWAVLVPVGVVAATVRPARRPRTRGRAAPPGPRLDSPDLPSECRGPACPAR